MARWILGHILLVPNKCLLNLQRFAGLYSDIWYSGIGERAHHFGLKKMSTTRPVPPTSRFIRA